MRGRLPRTGRASADAKSNARLGLRSAGYGSLLAHVFTPGVLHAACAILLSACASDVPPAGDVPTIDSTPVPRSAGSGPYADAPVYVISGAPTCGECRIEQIDFTTISDSSLASGAFGFGVIAYGIEPDYILLGAGAGLSDELYRVDRATGAMEQVGRKGDGPGEFRRVEVATSATEHLIFDRSARRVTRLARGSLRLLGTSPIPGGMNNSPAVFPDGRYLLNSTVPTSESIGYPVHIVSADGEVLRSLGGDPDEFVPGQTSLVRVVAASGDTAVWVARRGEYRIERWDSAGRLEAVYERHVDWFPLLNSAERASNPYPGNGEPRLTWMHEDSQGRLWVVVAIPRRKPADVGVPGAFWDKSASEVIIEILDLNRKEVIGSERIAGYPFVDGDFVFSDYYMTEQLAPMLDVWTYRLHTPNS